MESQRSAESEILTFVHILFFFSSSSWSVYVIYFLTDLPDLSLFTFTILTLIHSFRFPSTQKREEAGGEEARDESFNLSE